MRSPRWSRLGLRREVLTLLPLATLLLVLLSTFTLFSFRNAISSLAEARRSEAIRLARNAAESIPGQALPTAASLRQVAPVAQRLALMDAGGAVVASFGDFGAEDLLAPLAGETLTASLGVGPGGSIPDAVAAFVPLSRRQQPLILRLDLSAAEIARQRRGLRTLAWVVLPINLLLTAYVLLFLKHILEPYETLLARARSAGVAGADETDDEIALLVSTFERAVEALKSSPFETAEADIAALQRTLAPSLESGLLLLDRGGEVLALNAVGAGLLGLAENAGNGSDIATLLAPHPRLLQILQRAIERQRGAHRLEETIEIKGRDRILGLTVHALRRDDGSVRGFLVLFADLTESRRRADEERLASGLAQLGELAAGLAHELRNGLATLQGYLTLIDRRPDDGSIDDYVSEIRRESEHLGRVLEDFLAFARPETTRIEIVDLDQLVQRVAADPSLEGHPVTTAAPEQGRSRVRGDGQLLERAIRNLVLNAVQAERQRGRRGSVEIRLREHSDGVDLTIEDRGAGLPDDIRDRLFQPFVTGRPDGVGLGLSMAHRIVTLHGGTLRLEDRAGGGTRTIVAFPPGTIVT
jgi:PAS domain S-box-containing protein